MKLGILYEFWVISVVVFFFNFDIYFNEFRIYICLKLMF